MIANYCLNTIWNDAIQSSESFITPIIYMAPETISNNVYSKQSDIYSFGITLWQLYTDKQPYGGVDPVNVAVEVIVNQRRPSLDNLSVPQTIKKLLEQCWVADPTQRPSLDDIIVVLTRLIDHQRKLRMT